MFSSRLLRNIFIFEKVSASCKCSNEKSNVIKNLNRENKFLYGNLIETQKQKRKRLSKAHCSAEDVIKKSNEDRPDGEVEKLENDSTVIKKISKQRTKKPKTKQCSATATSVSLNCPSTEVTADLLTRECPTSHSLGIGSLNTQAIKKELKQIDSVNVSIDWNQHPIKGSENNTVVELSQYVVKSSDVNESNYPLDNSEKLELFSQSSQVEHVLSYNFSTPETKCYSKLPSVSKIMEQTMTDKNKAILNRWRQNSIADMGKEGFYKHLEGLKSRGQEFHLAVRNVVVGNSAGNCGEVTQNALKSLSWMLEHISHPMAVESMIAHPKLGYKGIPDCVAMFRNVPVVIDWKLSDKPKKDLKDTYEAPVQITAYIGALNHDPNYKWAVNHGLVAVAYTSGEPSDVFLLAPKHCQIYWRHWLMRVDKFKARSNLHLDHNIDEKELEFV